MHYYPSCFEHFVSGHMVTLQHFVDAILVESHQAANTEIPQHLVQQMYYSWTLCFPGILELMSSSYKWDPGWWCLAIQRQQHFCIDQDACPWIYPNSTLYISGIDLVQVELCCNHLLVFVIWKLDDFFSWPCDERILVELNSVVAMLSLSTVSLPIRLEATRKT